ncbi:conserved domain protein [Heliomicrobium modesticaldum Ice1]|uniref:UPF0291 protein HM1_2796 n=1 Tax=Heliobacterium modesticaldum (strain ATCC 51547 / Ice1) TaxID=498761 RepID=B0TCD7_HELMI|nr:DUF896 domain-containing protein [Heliomicrobium modesticaldum]ABZ85325.1 conserved domain protein [Heliomicrobium modesticaldum Ice1]
MSITKELIDRINYLSRKSRTPEGLTEEEKAEQARVRREYVDAIKARVKDTLDRVEIVDADQIASTAAPQKADGQRGAGASVTGQGHRCGCPTCNAKSGERLH